jgi:hypothetical protein
MTKQLTPGFSLLNKQHKGNQKKHRNQLRQFHKYLQKHTVTCSMAAKALGIPQKCLTRYKRVLELSGQLWEVKRQYCKLTGFPAWYLTTDPAKAPERPTQLKIILEWN